MLPGRLDRPVGQPHRLVELGHDQRGPGLGTPHLRVHRGHVAAERLGRRRVGGQALRRPPRLPQEAAEPLQSAGADGVVGRLRPQRLLDAAPRPRPGHRPSRAAPAASSTSCRWSGPRSSRPNCSARWKCPHASANALSRAGLARGAQAPLRRPAGHPGGLPVDAHGHRRDDVVRRATGQRAGPPARAGSAARSAAAGPAPPRTSGCAGTRSRRPPPRARPRRRPRGPRAHSAPAAAPTPSAGPRRRPRARRRPPAGPARRVRSQRVHAGEEHVLDPTGAGVADQFAQQVRVALGLLVPGVDVDLGRAGQRRDELPRLLQAEPVQLDVPRAGQPGQVRARPAAPGRPAGSRRRAG